MDPRLYIFPVIVVLAFIVPSKYIYNFGAIAALLILLDLVWIYNTT